MEAFLCSTLGSWNSFVGLVIHPKCWLEYVRNDKQIHNLQIDSTGRLWSWGTVTLTALSSTGMRPSSARVWPALWLLESVMICLWCVYLSLSGLSG